MDLKNLKNSSTAKVNEDTPLAFSMSTISSFRSIENKHVKILWKSFVNP